MHGFGMMSDFGSTSDDDDAIQKDSEAAIVDKLNALLDDSSSSSSYEDEPIVSECGLSQSHLPSLSKKRGAILLIHQKPWQNFMTTSSHLVSVKG